MAYEPILKGFPPRPPVSHLLDGGIEAVDVGNLRASEAFAKLVTRHFLPTTNQIQPAAAAKL
jgi:hypothetical protein